MDVISLLRKILKGSDFTTVAIFYKANDNKYTYLQWKRKKDTTYQGSIGCFQK